MTHNQDIEREAEAAQSRHDSANEFNEEKFCKTRRDGKYFKLGYIARAAEPRPERQCADFEGDWSDMAGAGMKDPIPRPELEPSTPDLIETVRAGIGQQSITGNGRYLVDSANDALSELARRLEGKP